MSEFDVIVVGAGSAGVPLAARLSEKASRRVLLVDAGPHFGALGSFPRELQHGSILKQIDPSHPNNWAIPVTLNARGVRQTVPRGKVVGGSSALNGCLFERGLPEDFAGWSERGNDQWSYERVLPYFRKLETDLDFTNQNHGANGPIPVRRHRPDEWLSIDRAFVKSCEDIGFPFDEDINSPNSYGVGPIPVNSIEGYRMNTAVRYLTDGVLSNRKNLAIQGDCFVRKIVFSGNTATGIEVERNGRVEIIYGREIVLSAGAVKSPHVLMLSGVGPAEQLKRCGIPMVHDSPGVGQNFSDHCSMGVSYKTRKSEKVDPLTHHAFQVGLHYTADNSPYPNDMMLLPSSIPFNELVAYNMSLASRARLVVSMLKTTSIAQLFDQIFHANQHRIGIILMKPESRGAMTLMSNDPHVLPELHYHYLESDLDIRRMREGFRLAAKLLDSPHYRELGAVRTLPSDRDYESNDILDDYIQSHVQTSIHLSGTCQMGGDSDEFAVTDQYCHVKGVNGVRVVDMSIWPEVTRRCANASAIMTGERAAEFFS